MITQYLNRLTRGFLLSGLIFTSLLMLQPSHALDASEVFTQKCGGCHVMSTFETEIENYDWPDLPLRTWLASHHKPRLPSISLSEAEITLMENSINELSSSIGGGAKVYEVKDDKSAAYPDHIEIEPESFATGVLNDDGQETQADALKGVSVGDCLNC